MERSLASEISSQGEKEAKVLSTHRAFKQKMNFCSWKGNRVCVCKTNNGPLQAVLCPPWSPVGAQYAVRVHYTVGMPFLQRWRRLGLTFSSEHWRWLCSRSLVLCALLHGHPREQRHSLQGHCQIFELLSVHQEHRKGTLTPSLETTF